MTVFNKGKVSHNSMFTKMKTPSSQDIDLRKKLKEIFENDSKASLVIYRRTRRNTNGTPILHEGVLSNRSKEAITGINSGMRYVFDDYLIRAYISMGSTYHESGEIAAYGDSKTDVLKMFMEYDCLYLKTGNKFDLPDELDQIITLERDIDGELRNPLKAKEIYDIGTVDPYRLDANGRVEFYSINLMSQPEKSIRL